MDVSVIIVNYNTASLLPRAMEALRCASEGLQVQTIIVDNASRDDSVIQIRAQFPDCSLIVNEHNVGFGRANNQALSQVTGRYVLLLNTDAFVAPDTLRKTVAYMDAHPKCGILGAKLTWEDGRPQPSARYFPTPWNRFLARTGLYRVFKQTRLVDDRSWDYSSARQCDWVPGCYYLVHKAVIDQVGLFDPRYFLYFEEVDHCRATKNAGWEVICFPETAVIHLGGESAKSEGELTGHGRQLDELQLESGLLYFRKHHGVCGVCLDVLLMILGDAIIVLKRVWHRTRPLGLGASAKHIALVGSLLVRTRWGTRPTR